MNWLIASDIHGSAVWCEKLMRAYENERAEKLILLGDILYHGPRNALPGEYDTSRVAEMLNSKSAEILCVRGNCDAEVDQMVLKFPLFADYALLPLGGKTVFLTHGHRYNEFSPPPMGCGDIILAGHTHIPKCAVYDTFVYLNPGSVSIPKGGSACGYMVLSDGKFVRKDFSGNITFEYDITKE